MNTNNIEVKKPEILTHKSNSMKNEENPLAGLTDEQINAELKRRNKARRDDRKAYKELSNEQVPSIINQLLRVSDCLAKAKQKVFQDANDLLKMKLSAYGVKDGQQSHTFSDENGDAIKLGFRVTDGWDDTVQTGVAKVNKYLEKLAKDEDSAWLVKAINRLLKKDSNGNLKSNRVIELDQLAQERGDEDLTDGVEIIKAAYKPVRSCWFIEATRKNSIGKDVSIPLSISAVDFPEGTDLSSFETKPK